MSTTFKFWGSLFLAAVNIVNCFFAPDREIIYFSLGCSALCFMSALIFFLEMKGDESDDIP